jgi:hypothetical protein
MSPKAPMADPPDFRQPPANDAGGPAEDVRDALRMEHDQVLASLDDLRAERDGNRCGARLRALRTAWVVHALAEETVVYRALEGVEDPGPRADERFVEHELVGNLFDKLAQARPRTLEWKARLNVVRELIARHIETEYRDLFPELAHRYDAEGLRELAVHFRLAREKLLVLEQAKAA